MAKSRKVSSISKEFDGKEVQGKLIERSGLLGSKVSKEVFKMPGGGKHIEKTRTNRKGDVVSRLSRDTKVNPLKVFNDNKQQAYKKAGGEMSKYKKSLKKAQPGIQVGPMTQEEAIKTAFASAENDPMNYGQGPRMTTPSDESGINLFQSELPGPIMAKSRGVRQMIGLEKRKGGSVKRKRK
jgi:hypothetical protein